MKCLLDTNLLVDALDLRGIDRGLEALWWGCEWILIVRKLQWLPRQPQPQDHRKWTQVRYLPRLRPAVDQGALEVFLSDAVVFEHAIGTSTAFWNLFGLDLRDIPQLRSGVALPHRYTLECAANVLSIEKLGGLSARLDSLISTIGEKHAADCLHLHTAELHSIDVFLTNDQRFRRAFEANHSKHGSPVRVLDPATLLASLGFDPAGDNELWRIRDYGSQQRLLPQCQFRWPRDLILRGWLRATGQIEFLPYHGELVIPPAAELWTAVRAVERAALGDPK